MMPTEDGSPVRVGERLCSTVCSTEVIVVRAPTGPVRLTCGGEPMAPAATTVPGAGSGPVAAGGAQLGKRYADEERGLELLVTKGGAGPLELDGDPLPVRQPKPLPSSD
jgi:hypothetical protein